MDFSKKDIIEYILAIIDEFAKTFGLTERQSYLYLKNHDALQFIENHYGIMHTLDFKDSIEGISNYCKRNGGSL